MTLSSLRRSSWGARGVLIILSLLIALQGTGLWAATDAARLANSETGPRPLSLAEMAAITGGALPEKNPFTCINQWNCKCISMLLPPGNSSGHNALGGPSPSPTANCPMLADPVELGQGRVQKDIFDVELPVRGDLFFGHMRIYGQVMRMEGLGGENVDPGEWWTSSTQVQLYAHDGSDDLILRNYRGEAILFFQDPNDTDLYYSDINQGYYAYIEEEVDGSYTLTMRGGTVVTFDSDGLLDRITDRNGNYLEYTWTTGGLEPELGSISPNGATDSREIEFHYWEPDEDSMGNLARVSDGSGTNYVSFTYDATEHQSAQPDPDWTINRREHFLGGRITTYVMHEGDGYGTVYHRMAYVNDSNDDRLVAYSYVNSSPDMRPDVYDGESNMILDWHSWTGSTREVSLYNGGGAGRMRYTLDDAFLTTQMDRQIDSIYTTAAQVYLIGEDSGHSVQMFQPLLLRELQPNGEWVTYTFDTTDIGAGTQYDDDWDFTVYSNPREHLFQANLTRIDYEDDTFTTFAYGDNLFCQMTSTVDRWGRGARFDYDTTGNLTTATVHGIQTTYAYDSYGQVIQQGDAHGRVSTFAYSDIGLVASTGDPDGSHTRLGYDGEGRLTTTTNHLGLTTTYAYSSAGLVTTTVYPTGAYATFAYDSEGNRISARDGRGNISTYAYDRYGRIAEVHDALGGVTTYGYDRAGNLTTFTDAEGNITTYAFDEWGNQILERNAGGQYATYAYSMGGCSSCSGGGGFLLTSSRNMRGEYTSHVYGSDGRLSTLIFHDGERVTHVYDSTTELPDSLADSRLILGNGTFQYDYDDERHPARVIQPDGAVISFTYDEFDRRQSLTDPDGNVTCFIYNTDGRLYQIRNGFGQVTTYSHDTYGRLISQENWNGTSTTRGFDAYGRMNDLVNWLEDGSVGQRVQYCFDANANVTRTTFAVDTAADEVMYVNYSYDTLDRLICEEWRLIAQWSEWPTIVDDSRLWQRNYVYDAVGNRTVLGYYNGSTTTTVTYSYNNLNQLTSMSSGTYRYFRYDDNGNLLARTTAVDGDEGWFYTWTQDDRMARAYLVLDSKVGEHRGTTFVYDAGGRRLLRQDDDSTWTRFYYDGLNVLLEREATTDPSTWDESLLVDCDGGGTSSFTIWDDDPTGSTLTNEWASPRQSLVVAFDPASGTDNGARTAGSWNDSTGDVLTFQRRGGTGADIRIWMSTSAGTRTCQIGTWISSASRSGSWYYLPMPSSLNDGDWHEVSLDLQAVIDNLESGATLTDIDYIEWRGEADYDTIRVAQARTTRVFTLAPSALGGILSVRDLGDGTYSGIENTDTWYHYDRLGNVMLTTDSTGDSNGLRWQDAYGNQLASESTGSWATAAAAEGYGLTTKEYDGDVELYYFWQRWHDSSLALFVNRAPLPDWREHPFAYAAGNPNSNTDPDGRLVRWRSGCGIVTVPAYGNWCGGGLSGPAGPIDDLDICCMEHDIRYTADGIEWRPWRRRFWTQDRELKNQYDIALCHCAREVDCNDESVSDRVKCEYARQQILLLFCVANNVNPSR